PPRSSRQAEAVARPRCGKAGVCPSGRRRDALRIPGVSLPSDIAAPGIQRVVEHEAVTQLLVVIPEVVRQAEGDREEPGALRGEVAQCRVGAEDDERHITTR